MCSTRDNVALPTLGFPIRASAGHWPFSASPRLIAAVHALHRLLVPRHPPYALTILTVISGEPCGSPGDTRVIGYCAVFKVREEANPPRRRSGPGPASSRRRAGLSKLNSMRGASPRPRSSRRTPCQVRSTCLVAGRARRRASRAQERETRELRGDDPPATGAREGLPRKEVIQPQLPLRLPCYDFTPVTSPTFDGSLPKGLGHRLRVLLTPMV
jgi:hypothetical protein